MGGRDGTGEGPLSNSLHTTLHLIMQIATKKRFFLLTLTLLLLPILAVAQPTIDGDLSDAQYETIATKQNANSSFGSAIDVQELVYYADDANATLYIGIRGKLDVTNNNGIGLWLNITGDGSPNGRSAGTSLAVSGAGHYISGDGGNESDFSADFEVDAMYAFNPGGGATNVFFDAANVIGGTPSATFVGSSDQSGTSATGTGPGGETITFAVDNSGGANTGIELRIPFAELDASASMSVEAFAMVVSSSAFFSNVTVPGNYTGTDQPGFNASFDTFSGGPYHSDPPSPLPVELTSFDVAVDGAGAQLRWTTATETNNSGFAIQHAAPGEDFQRVGWRDGAGTTTEPQTYRFRVDGLSPGAHRFRLKQVDVDGTTSLSDVVDARVGLASQAVMTDAAPNPVRSHATLQVGVQNTQPVAVELYNLLGQKVRTLHRGTLPGGRMEQIDIRTSGLSSGIYIVRMQSASFSKTRRLTVVR
jgi:hypothetical protein